MSFAETHLSDARITIAFFTFSLVRLHLGFDACEASSMSSLLSQNIAYHRKMFKQLKQSLPYTILIIISLAVLPNFKQNLMSALC
jgi:hypothetical protein